MRNNIYRDMKVSVRILDGIITLGIAALAVLIAIQF